MRWGVPITAALLIAGYAAGSFLPGSPSCSDRNVVATVEEVMRENARNFVPDMMTSYGISSERHSPPESRRYAASISLITVNARDAAVSRVTCGAAVSWRYDRSEVLAYNIEYSIQPPERGDGYVVTVRRR